MKINGNNIEEVNRRARVETPLHNDAFSINDETKIDLISTRFEEILQIIGLDLSNDSLKETPRRIAKMYINEIFSGINPKNRPSITLFKNEYAYENPLIEMDIPFTSFCEHHFVPIIGKANVAYIPNEYVIGLSKIHRLVDYYARRPQVQERLTLQIKDDLEKTLNTQDVGVVLKASHSCISCRGVEHSGSKTITSAFGGKIMLDQSLISILRGPGV